MKYKTEFLSLMFILGFTLAFSQEQEVEEFIQEIAGSDLEIVMVKIPQGTFTLGSPEDELDRSEDEGPAHRVQIDEFQMSKYEISWELYNLFVNRAIDDVESKYKGVDVSKKVDAVSGATMPYVDMSMGMGTGSDLPVANVTQFAASKFCEWLSAKTGYFYRLPTEAEWEYAARAGTTTSFYFGEDASNLDEYAWYEGNSEGSYHKVGQKKPNSWGLYDMYGNVAEWTLDQYLPQVYKNRKNLTENPFESAVKEYPRSVRGGSYSDEEDALRSAARLGSSENWKMRDPQFPKSKWWNTDAPFVGFRIVKLENPPAESEYKKYWGYPLN